MLCPHSQPPAPSPSRPTCIITPLRCSTRPRPELSWLALPLPPRGEGSMEGCGDMKGCTAMLAPSTAAELSASPPAEPSASRWEESSAEAAGAPPELEALPAEPDWPELWSAEVGREVPSAEVLSDWRSWCVSSGMGVADAMGVPAAAAAA